ncbi:unnamed protein product [Rotaria socialis]|uniref:Uncharacterized protein n=2 Tax=Rotaria socialis TaxID=392032 RepID=A0A820QF77_9BILA|nr:unnamed protein product [Rotaria socialis]CAF3385053.1 unnamed protein product [Rotaria socialis]CAF3631151.1 unnamed protein product [Rotaria socialis]CAF4419445.1 unnamed protein product [Rotaria socialis]CAF4758522.1 unnamed protein product [Rotaria socialis]
MYIGHWLSCFWRRNNDPSSNSSMVQSQSYPRNFFGSDVFHSKLNSSVNNCSSRFECFHSPSVDNNLIDDSSKLERAHSNVNLINIGFVTDGKNVLQINGVLKTLFLHRQSLDFLSIHIVAPKSNWSLIDGAFKTWYSMENGLGNSFNHTLYDSSECTSTADVFQPYFDGVYRIAFCKLVIPYLVNPFHVPYMLLLDFDIIVVSNHFTTDCWLQAIKKLEEHPYAIFSIAHQGSPKTKPRPFPMPYLEEYRAHFHFNNGVILFHIARIHELDQLVEHNTTVSVAYPAASGPRRWLRDFQQDPPSLHSTIQVTTDKFVLYLDYDSITETTSIDQALCTVISLYVIFELQFGTHNRIIHLLHGILLQEPVALTKQLRWTLKEWKFQIGKNERKQISQVVNITSTNNQTHTTSLIDLPHLEENIPDDLSYEEPDEDLLENKSDFEALVEVKQQLSVNLVSDDVQNPTTT